jgi:hypothetical protein
VSSRRKLAELSPPRSIAEVGFKIVRVIPRGHFSQRQLNTEFTRNPKRDMVRQLEEISHLAVIGLGPQMLTCNCVDELDRDPQWLVRPLQTSLQEVTDREGLGHLANRRIVTTESARPSFSP